MIEGMAILINDTASIPANGNMLIGGVFLIKWHTFLMKKSESESASVELL